MIGLKSSMFFILMKLYYFLYYLLYYAENAPLVSTSLGEIKGYYKISPTGSKYKAFEGIPFAEPPIGKNRFQPPKQVKRWEGKILANRIKEKCWINEPYRQLVRGSEDCLYLNLYVPFTKSNQSLPVIVYIYGGGFQMTSLQDIEERNFMDKNVIFITFNHRMGVLGFLSTENHVVPGNMGLKDQVMALKWIKDHIESFGGDSNRITITGLSAGGASIQYLLLSPMSRGLFSNGISHSGTALMPWAQTENSREKCIKLGKLMNCTSTKIHKMIQCLKQKPARSLVEAQRHFWGWRDIDFTPFGPVVEKNATDAFIDRPPIEIIKSGEAQDLPWITGVVSEEGLYPLAEFILNNTVMKELDENWTSIAPHLLQYYYTIPKSDHLSVSRKIREFFFNDDPIDEKNLHTLIKMVSDRLFKFDSVKAAKLQVKKYNSPVWYYFYNYRANSSLSDFLSRTKKNFGVSHSDDVRLIFLDSSKLPKSDVEVQKRLIDIWVSVAYSGKPVSEPQWQKLNVNTTDFNYLEIAGPERFDMKTNNSLSNSDFWNSIHFKENIL